MTGTEVVVVATMQEARHIKREWPLLRDAMFVVGDAVRAVEGLRVSRVFVAPLAAHRGLHSEVGYALEKNLMFMREGTADPAFLYLGERGRW